MFGRRDKSSTTKKPRSEYHMPFAKNGIKNPIEDDPHWKKRISDFVNEKNKSADTDRDVCINENKTDRENYSIKATRVADFLVLEVTRFIEVENGAYGQYTTSEAVNLSKTSSITKLEGQNVQDREIKTLHYGNLRDEFVIPINYYCGRVIFTEPGSDRSIGVYHWTPSDMSYQSTDLTHEKIIYPLFAIDDTITFNGCNLRLQIPHGLLEEVYGIIMDAIAAGYVPPKNSIFSK